MSVVRLLQRGQLTLPTDIGEQTGVTEGDSLLCYLNPAGEIVLQPLPSPASVWDPVGAAKPVRPLDVSDARLRTAADRIRRRLVHHSNFGNSCWFEAPLRSRTVNKGRPPGPTDVFRTAAGTEWYPAYVIARESDVLQSHQ